MNLFYNSRSVVLGLIITVVGFTFAQAQDLAKNTGNSTNGVQSQKAPEPQTEYSTTPNEIGFYGGVSTFHKDLRGPSAGGNLGVLAFRFSHRMIDGKSIKLRYVADFIPVAIMNYPRDREFQTSTGTTEIIHDRKTVYGFGIAPGGLQLNFRNRKKYQPFIAGNVGIMYLTEIVPDFRTPLHPRATGAKINYTAEFGAGLEIGLKENRNFFVGYKYHHLSNLYTGNINIGYNSNMIYAGMMFGY